MREHTVYFPLFSDGVPGKNILYETMLQFYYLAARMLAHPSISRCIAFFLMLVFAQKSLAGLFVHDRLHITNTAKESPVKQEGQDAGLKYNCTCVDDFLMPVDVTTAPVYFQPALIAKTKEVVFKTELLYSIVIFSLLRGPPTCIS